ncbi:DUF6712 family protein [Epilithonimonas hominis]|uniref:DUF6712 family protein n=1 Tax=Epilithonimonas hominis TaxID=420404 RepID=UPI002898C5DA|nr:DUF6712 family protein [Epilithonimonas hominis]
MEQYITKEQLEDYLILPNNFDWDLIDQEVGFSKVFDFFPVAVYNSFKNSADSNVRDIYKLLTKAGVYYSFILSLPKLKVQITNYGVQIIESDKTKSSPWWDVRDLGLSLLKIADRCLSDSLKKASKIESVKTQINFFKNVSEFICTPEEFENIYSINYSPEVFMLLQKFIKKALIAKVYDKLKADCVASVKSNPELLPFLKDALAFYALYYASLLPGFIFTNNAIVIQYDELPWQKSVVLTQDEKKKSGENFLKIADESLKIIIDYIKNHLSDFPCYSGPAPERTIQVRDSGLYL